MFQLKSWKSKDSKEVDSDIEKMAEAIHAVNHRSIPADVLGSYTGTPRDGENPTQDADDL